MPDEIPINESVFEQQTGGRFSQPLRQNQPPPIQPAQRHVPPITPPVQQQTGGRFSQPLRQNQPPPIQPAQRHVPPITPPVQQQTGGRFSQPLRQNQPPPIQPVQRHVPPITPPVQAPSLASLQTRSLARPSSFWRSMLGVALICITVIVVVINSSHTNLFSFATNNIQTQGTPAPSYVPSNATLALQDPLQDNSKGFQWIDNENDLGSCLFQNNAYHAVVYGNTGAVFHDCSIQNTTIDFSNFVYQVTMIIQSGECGGIIFRSHNPQLYYFKVCIDGTYKFASYISDSDGSISLANNVLPSTPQIGQPIMLAVVANGSNMTLYVNQQQVGQPVTDYTYTDGQIGVIAANEGMGDSTTTEVIFSDAYVWTF